MKKKSTRGITHCTLRLLAPLMILLNAITIGNGQKSYIAGSVSGLPSLFTPNARIVVGDFDGDGDKDILYQNGNIQSVDIHYLRNNSNSTFTAFNANGLGQFVSGTPFTGITFTFIMDPDKSTTGQPIAQRVLDYDGDGDQDILEIKTTGTARILLQNAGSYSVGVLSAQFPTALNSSVSRWITADVDSDGDDDVLYQSGNAPNTDIHLLVNNKSGNWLRIDANSSGQFTSGPLNGLTFSKIGNTADIVQFFLDIDSDGDKDLYELTTSSNRYFVRSGGSFTAAALPANLPTSVSPALFRIFPADYDKDADVDFLYQTSNASQTNIRYLQNNHNNTFTATNAAVATGTFSGINTPFGPASFNFISRAATNREQLLIDLDGDIDLDMLQLGTLATSVYISTGANLPVKLEYFTVNKKGSQVEVDWKTSEEINVDHFGIEHSLDATSFRAVGSIKSKGSSTGGEYSYVHSTPAKGLQYYRLAEYDLDGTVTYFPIKSILFDELKKPVEIKSNVTSGIVTAYFKQSAFRQVLLIDRMGRTIQKIAITNQQAQINIDLTSMASGIYYLKFVNNENSITERIVKQ